MYSVTSQLPTDYLPPNKRTRESADGVKPFQQAIQFQPQAVNHSHDAWVKAAICVVGTLVTGAALLASSFAILAVINSLFSQIIRGTVATAWLYLPHYSFLPIAKETLHHLSYAVLALGAGTGAALSYLAHYGQKTGAKYLNQAKNSEKEAHQAKMKKFELTELGNKNIHKEEKAPAQAKKEKKDWKAIELHARYGAKIARLKAITYSILTGIVVVGLLISTYAAFAVAQGFFQNIVNNLLHELNKTWVFDLTLFPGPEVISQRTMPMFLTSMATGAALTYIVTKVYSVIEAQWSQAAESENLAFYAKRQQQ